MAKQTFDKSKHRPAAGASQSHPDNSHATVISFALEGDQPVVGDWNGWGTARLGVFRGGQWIMRSRGIAYPTSEETEAFFGLPGDHAIPWPAK